MNAIKPGTRCECRMRPEDFPAQGETTDHSLAHMHGGRIYDACGGPAVRMVTVRIAKCLTCGEDTTHAADSSFYGHVHRWGPTTHKFKSDGGRNVPMCEPCATWHESKAVAR